MVLLLIGGIAAQFSGSTTFHGLRGDGEYILTSNSSGGEGGNWGSALISPIPGPYVDGIVTKEFNFYSVEPLAIEHVFVPGEKIEANATLGEGNGAGMVEVLWELKLGSTLLAQGAATSMTYANSYETLTWSVDPLVGSIPASTERLEWRIYTEGHVGLGFRAALGNEATTISLPFEALPEAPASIDLETQVENVTATNIALEYTYEEPSNQVWHYNWKNHFATGNISMSADPVSGSVRFQIIDDGNQTITDAQLEAYFTENQTFEGSEGDWQIIVTFTDFQGNATLTVLPDAPPTPVPGLPTGGNPNTPGSGTPTGGTFSDGNNQDEGEDTPPASLLIGLIGLTLLANRKGRSR